MAHGAGDAVVAGRHLEAVPGRHARRLLQGVLDGLAERGQAGEVGAERVDADEGYGRASFRGGVTKECTY
ncbi:hypothetical protein QR97_28655 [Streptomyces sp. PBH53]|nr:hypothetical protein QR97_28655 [Streptomyces sp. PBH53]